MSTPLKSAFHTLLTYENYGLKAIEQLNDEGVSKHLGDGNSVAQIVKHLHGNMLSRWTDFLTSDGEKAWRQRDDEFENAPATKEEVVVLWKAGWQQVKSALEPLSENDLDRTITIRTKPHSVIEAIHRQLAHYAYHTGQIILLAKWVQGDSWETLSIPKGKSGEFVDKPFLK